jgi:hypothetical protein
MANVNVKSGLTPVRYMSSANPYSGGGNVYSVDPANATAIFVGDPVKLAGTGQTINGMIYQDVVQAATGDVMTGVVVAVLPDTRDSVIYRAASTQRLVLVADDPGILFEIQEVGTGTAFTVNDLGLNANFVVSAGNATTGISGVELDNSTEATTNTLDLQIVGFANRTGNEIGLNAKWLVRINRHQRANQVAGI